MLRLVKKSNPAILKTFPAEFPIFNYDFKRANNAELPKKISFQDMTKIKNCSWQITFLTCGKICTGMEVNHKILAMMFRYNNCKGKDNLLFQSYPIWSFKGPRLVCAAKCTKNVHFGRSTRYCGLGDRDVVLWD